VSIDGQRLGQGQRLAAGQLAEWYVEAGTFASASPVIKIALVGGTASEFVFDKICMSGSFVAGVNNWQNSDFGGSPRQNITIGLRDMQKFPDGANQTFPTYELRFFVTSSEAALHSFTYSSRAYNFGAGSDALTLIEAANFTKSRYPFEMLINDCVVYTAPTGLPNGTQFSFGVPDGMIQAGWNTLKIRLTDTLYDTLNGVNYWWMGFDYHKMEISRGRKGLRIILR